MTGALGVVLGLIGGWLAEVVRSYATEKGKNLATKEDVAEITDKIEGVRTSYSRELENLRADLARRGHESGTRFQALHARRVDAIEGIYRRLVKVRVAFHELLITSDESEEWDIVRDRTGKAADDLLNFFADTRLYLTPGLVDGLAELNSAMKDGWIAFTVTRPLYRDDRPMPADSTDQRLKAWRQGKDRIMTDIPNLIEGIEREMRAVLDSPETVAVSRVES